MAPTEPTTAPDDAPASDERVGSLTLTRKPGESVLLTTPGGETVLITCVELRPNQVRLTFAAPRSVEIARTELLLGEANRGAVRRGPGTP